MTEAGRIETTGLEIGLGAGGLRDALRRLFGEIHRLKVVPQPSAALMELLTVDGVLACLGRRR